MKLLSAVLLATLLCVGLAHASITPILDGTSTSGLDTTYNYEISVDPNETLIQTGCSGAFIKVDGSCTWFTIDIADYVPGSIAAPSGWTDSYAAGVLTWAYTGPTTTGTGLEITGFSAESTLASQSSQFFTYQTGNIGGGWDIGAGTVGAVPEPTSLSLFGGGLIGLAILVRRKFARS